MGDGVIFPPVFHGERVNGFFTTKKYGADPEMIADLCRLPESHVYMPVQKHTDKIAVVGYDMEPIMADAVVTDRNDILIGVRVADCVPILVYERKKGIAAAVHAGWRGTAATILKKTIRTMEERFFVAPDNMLMAIGPSIGVCCYAVDYDVCHVVMKATGEGNFHSEKGGKYYLDLASANRIQAISAGVREDNVWVSGDCTFCNPDRYYSYRYAKGTTGRQGGFIGRMKDERC